MDVKPIFNSYVAKQLVLLGNRIVDLQPNRNNRDLTIFYFEVNDKFTEDLYKVLNS